MSRTMVLVGTYTQPILFGTGEVFQAKGKGIYLYELRDGALRLCCTAKAVNASWLSLNRAGTNLYATNEVKEWQGQFGGAVSAYAVDLPGERLIYLNSVGTRGQDPCHLALSPEEDSLYCANYMSGSIAAFPVGRDGSLERASFFAQHEGGGPDEQRQKGPHAHGVFLSPGGRWLYASDLGKDTLVCYARDASGHMLHHCPERDIVMPDRGAGTRHLAFHPDGRHLYVNAEMGSCVYTFDYDEKSGRAGLKQRLSTVPEGTDLRGTSAAAIRIHPNGRLLFVSNRGHNSIATYRIDPESGLLELTAVQPTGGQIPRDFALDPEGNILVVAHQSGDDLQVYALNPENGNMTFLSRTEVPSPICVQIVRTEESDTGSCL